MRTQMMIWRGVVAASAAIVLLVGLGCSTKARSPAQLDAMSATQNLHHWRDLKEQPLSGYAEQGWTSPAEYTVAVWARARNLRSYWKDSDAALVLDNSISNGMHKTAVLYVMGWPHEVTEYSSSATGARELWSYGIWPSSYTWVSIGASDRVISWESSN